MTRAPVPSPRHSSIVPLPSHIVARVANAARRVLLGALFGAMALAIGQMPAKADGLDLFVALKLGDDGELSRLLKSGESPDATDILSKTAGVTPLMEAARLDNMTALELLLAAGANPLRMDDAGRTAAWYAAYGSATDAFNRLMRIDGMRALIDTPDLKTGSTMLHMAVFGFDPEITRMLLAMGASTELRNVFGQRPEDICAVSDSAGCKGLE